MRIVCITLRILMFVFRVSGRWWWRGGVFLFCTESLKETYWYNVFTCVLEQRLGLYYLQILKNWRDVLCGSDRGRQESKILALVVVDRRK